MNDIGILIADLRIQGSSLRTPSANDIDLVEVLKEIVKSLDSLFLIFDLGYYEIDDDGNQISEDINIRI